MKPMRAHFFFSASLCLCRVPYFLTRSPSLPMGASRTFALPPPRANREQAREVLQALHALVLLGVPESRRCSLFFVARSKTGGARRRLLFDRKSGFFQRAPAAIERNRVRVA